MPADPTEPGRAGAAPGREQASAPPERPAAAAPSPLSPGRGGPLFLHRDTYRRRRVMDAARVLPILGAALLLLPLLWAPDHTTASGAVYLFLAWFILIIGAAVLSRKLSEPVRLRDRAARGGDLRE